MNNHDRGGTNVVKSDVTVAEILASLNEQGLAGVTDVATDIDRPKSTVHNHLATLQAEGLVVKEDQQYALSLQFLEYGESARLRRVDQDVVRQKVADIADETDERVQFIVEERNLAVYLFIATGAKAVTTDSQIGKHLPLHVTAAGKSILANLSEERRNTILETIALEPHTENSVTVREDLLEELTAIRERGYALNKEEHTEGLRAVGAPVIGPEGSVIGAISVSGPTHRMKGTRLESKIPDLLLAETNEIELRITFE